MNDTQNRVKLLIDKRCWAVIISACLPCINTSTLKIKTVDIIRKIYSLYGSRADSEIPEEAGNDSQ